MAWAPLLHRIHLVGSSRAHGAFRRALRDPEGAQRACLRRILQALHQVPAWQHLPGDLSYEAFRDQVAPRTYAEIEGDLEQQRRGGRVHLAPPTTRWQPTSGSTARRKWIPYPPAFLRELDGAAGAWMVDLAQRAPAAFRGRHYWSLSWMPSELRQAGSDPDDLTLLPAWKRLALGQVMAVPSSVAQLPTSEASLVATAAWLAAREDLALLSVWSPTFGLTLLQTLADHREALVEALRSGRGAWGPCPRHLRAAARLQAWDGRLDPAFFRELWPGLGVISAWDEAASAPHATRWAGLLPHAHFQSKGLWATEGVVTFPFQDTKPLALTSHFLEFKDLDTGRIHPSWELAPGQVVQPLLSTSAGLLRYALEDRCEVTGLLERTPCLAFRGRLGGTDLVGEKLDAGAVGDLLASLDGFDGWQCLTLFALSDEPCRYALLAEGEGSTGALAERLEQGLQAFHHYRLARELNQLGPVDVWGLKDARPLLERIAQARQQAGGEAKTARLASWPAGLEVPPWGGFSTLATGSRQEGR